MKKLLYFVSIFILFNVGCSNNSLIDDEKTDTFVDFEKQLGNNNASLIYQLNNFNMSYQEKMGNEIEYRDFWGTLGKIVAVAGADVIGAGAGIWILFNSQLDSCIYAYINCDYDIDTLIQKTYDKSLITEKMKSVFRSFFAIYNMVKSKENVKDIINYYIKTTVESNELNETEKEALVASFSVASESPFYWNAQNIINN